MDISLMDMGKFCLRYVKHPFWMLAALIATLSSCSDGDNYVNAIPGGSMALISIDMPQQAKGKADSRLLSQKNMLHVDDLSDCGLDVSAKFYLFEAPDGNLGLCAKVKDSGDLKHWLEKLSAKGICTSLSERRGCHFAVMKNSWLVGFSDEALLVMGPVVGSAQAELRQQMVRYLKAKEETGIKSSPMFACIDTISSPMAMVAQTQAFPEKFVAPFILGAPKEADPSQIVIAAKIAVNGQCLDIDGHTFSFNKAIDAKLQKNNQVFRPLEGHYSDFVFSDKLMTLFLNVNGREFLPILQQNKAFQTFLVGINSAVDMDNILRCVDGHIVIQVNNLSEGHADMCMGAELADIGFWKDIDYWKKSCPKGSTITAYGFDQTKPSSVPGYVYTNGDMKFYFGSLNKNFFCGTDIDMVMSLRYYKGVVDQPLEKQLIGKRLVMVLNLLSLGDMEGTSIASFLKPLFGDVNKVFYSIR